MRACRPACLAALALLAACSSQPAAPGGAVAPHAAANLVLVTIDTLRADRVGAYGYAAARTPTLDRVARDGARFDRAYAAAPITLTSHASLLTGLYPPGHGARHNGIPVGQAVPTLATLLRDRGFATAAFVAAFPLDRRFGLARGFDVYSDRMPRMPDGRLANERPGAQVVTEAIDWLAGQHSRFFLWVHLFEPHAPYGDPARDHRPAALRYDDEVAGADAQVGRLLGALGTGLPDTLVVVAGDHGESFGEHGELGHSLFVYDTTLRVPLLMAGPGIPRATLVRDPVSLVDVVPTVLPRLGIASLQADGVNLAPALAGTPLPARALYAESFAPLFDFGWSPLRSLREKGLKAIAAPRPELYDVERDPGETANAADRPDLPRLLARLDRISPATPGSSNPSAADPEARARLSALGYVQGSQAASSGATRPDPKDRRELAARIEMVTSGEVQGAERLSLLLSLSREDPRNGQVRLRLGDALVRAGRAKEAEPHFAAAIAAHVPSADPYLGLALCQAQRGALSSAAATLRAADRVEPGNAVVLANLGLLEARAGHGAEAEAALRRALDLDPDLHEARFNLALVYARSGRQGEATAQARELLRRLPADAPQRPEVERLLAALRSVPREP